MYKLLLKDAFFATIAVFIIYGLLNISFLNLGFLDPVHKAVHHVKEEYENLFIDITKGKHSQRPAVADTSIYLVNIDTLSRPEIGRVLSVINKYQPKVIGLDIVLNDRKAQYDSTLQNALKEAKDKLVLCTAFNYKQDTLLQEQEKAIGAYQIGDEGFANFVAPSETGIVRYFLPQFKEDSIEHESFATQILKNYDLKIYETFIKHRQATEEDAPEVIVYQRPAQDYHSLQPAEVFDSENPELPELKNKIVLMGYWGDSTDIEDKHYSPFYAGGKYPDMSGVAIHANIIEMILHQDYIRYSNDWIVWLISFILTFGLMIFFVHQFVKYHLWFHLVFKVVQFLSAAIIFGVGLLVFHGWQIKIDTLKIIVPIALSVDVLYFYDSFVQWLHKKFHYHTYFKH